MCKAPKPPAPKDPEKPEYLRNPYLDAAIGQSGSVDQIRAGRSSLRIDLAGPGGTVAPTSSVNPVAPPTPTAPPSIGLPGIRGNPSRRRARNGDARLQIR